MSQYSVVSPDGSIKELKTEDDLGLFSSQSFLGKDLATTYFVIDIDDTLRSSQFRISLAPSPEAVAVCGDQPNKAWTEFNDNCHLDFPLTDNIFHIKNLISRCVNPVVVFLTSCTASELSAMVTKTQLISYGFKQLLTSKDYHLVMRGSDNQRTPLKMKMDFMDGTVLNKMYRPNVTIIDDNKEIIQEFTSQGYRTILV